MKIKQLHFAASGISSLIRWLICEQTLNLTATQIL